MPDIEKTLTFPGFVDVHVHFRDPGVPAAETTESALASALRGGMAAVVTMPNTTPPIDTPESVSAHAFSRDRNVASPLVACERGDVLLLTSACITRGRQGKEVADLEALAEAGAVFFTDDGTYVADAKVLEEAMRRAYDLNLVVSQHALCPGMSEADCVRRDLSICRETGCRYHVQHISTAEGVALVREAQAEGLPVTAEATPHHILLTKDDIPADSPLLPSGYFKMAPPLATAEDRAEVRRGVKDGILMFATDHAPHPAAVKNCGYEKAANGIIGLETAIPITYQVMVEEEGMSVDAWAEAWWKKPLDILPRGTVIPRETTVALHAEPRAVDVSAFASLSRNCPYNGMKFRAWPVCNGCGYNLI